MIDEKKLIEDIKECYTDEFLAEYGFDKLVEAQPKVNEWIPVSERLPAIEDYILMSLKNLDVAIGFRSNTEDYWYYGGQYLSYDSVVAWMPLPTPFLGE